MDNGPAKIRRRSRKPEVMAWSFDMTTAQLADLRTFVNDTLFGVRRFNFTHPVTSESVEVRIIASGDGEFYKYTNADGPNWHVSMQVEVMP